MTLPHLRAGLLARRIRQACLSRPVRALALAALLLPGAGLSPLQAPAQARASLSADEALARRTGTLAEPARVLVKYRAGSALMLGASSGPVMRAQGTRAGFVAGQVLPRHAQALGQRLGLGLALSDGPVLGTRVQSVHAVGLSAQALAAQLALQPDVEWAVPVGRKQRASATAPNDPLYPGGLTAATPAVGQWYLRPAGHEAVSALNAPAAWGITTGSASVVVAVVDTGVRTDHEDLAGKLLPGYDFVSRTSASNDGTGIDSDPSDPGDWCAGEGASSSWHGTLVSGLIGAATDNGIGMAGIGRDVKLLPVRVLGQCGGYDDDIVAGLRWAAGLDALHANAHPAQVVNISLGGDGVCSDDGSTRGATQQLYRDTIAELIARHITVVAAAGNNAGQAVILPANCPGVIAVGAARHIGTKVGFSSVGPEVSIAAPGGNCVNTRSSQPCLYPLIATTNSGTRGPVSNAYTTSSRYEVGTSFSAPLVAGTVGLMLSANPALTPAQVRTALMATARPFPTIGAQDSTSVACRAPDTATEQLECYCTTSTCGAGLLDAGAAVARAAGSSLAPQAVIAVSGTAVAGSSVQLSATSSSVGVAGYQWSVSGGSTLGHLVGATNGPTATLAIDGGGTVTVALTVTDAGGRSATGSAALVTGPALSLSPANPGTTVGSRLTLTATATPSTGRSISSYQWDLVDGSSVVSVASRDDTATLQLDALAAGSASLQLTVIDSAGGRTALNAVVTVTSAGSSSGSSGGSSSSGSDSGSGSSGSSSGSSTGSTGGGALGGPGGALGGLGLLAAWLALRPRATRRGR